MSNILDPLLQTLRADPSDPTADRLRSDRLHYATGELLGADDFQAEQLYHRRQLARALLFLVGSGTLGGLKVVVEPQRGGNPADVSEVNLVVRPGIAIDRAGRLIEVPAPACLRLRRWFDFIADPKRSGDPNAQTRFKDAFNPTTGTVVADVFLSFHACQRGWTPVFASGPFDALDASQPSRVRDAYELLLVLRTEADADLADPEKLGHAWDPWRKLPNTSTGAEIRELIFQAWTSLDPPAPDLLQGFHECPVGVDPTAVLLARLQVPSAAATATDIPTRADDLSWKAATWFANPPVPNEDNTQNVDNSVRNVIVPPAMLRRLHSI